MGSGSNGKVCGAWHVDRGKSPSWGRTPWGGGWGAVKSVGNLQTSFACCWLGWQGWESAAFHAGATEHCNNVWQGEEGSGVLETITPQVSIGSTAVHSGGVTMSTTAVAEPLSWGIACSCVCCMHSSSIEFVTVHMLPERACHRKDIKVSHT